MKYFILNFNIKRNNIKDYSFKVKFYNINLLVKKNKDEYILSFFINR